MKDSSGFTLVEVLVVLIIIGTMAAFAMPSVLWANKPLENASKQVAGNFKVARAKAVAKTSAYRITAVSATQFLVESATRCDKEPSQETWEVDSTFDTKLPQDTELIPKTLVDGTEKSDFQNWNVCFNSRGAANKALQITLKDNSTKTQQKIQVLKGGMVTVGEAEPIN